VFQAGVQEAASADDCMCDGLRERGSTLDRHPAGYSLYCFGMAASDPVYNPELFGKVWLCEEE
jgi:hypothetical protein